MEQHNQLIFTNWNKDRANSLLKKHQDSYLKSVEYYNNRILGQSVNIFAAKDRAFEIAKDMLSCFHNPPPESKLEIIEWMKAYYFNPNIVTLLEEIECIQFEPRFNSSPSAWMNNTIKMYAAYSLLYNAFKSLVESVNNGERSRIYDVLSSADTYSRMSKRKF